MERKVHDKAKSAGISFIIDTHNDLDYPTSKGEKFADAILRSKEGKIADVDSG